jgi:hypothetical protein
MCYVLILCFFALNSSDFSGHRALWMKNTLHRDVSIYNVLTGKADAQLGNRGILIDLDMAIDVSTYIPSKDPRTVRCLPMRCANVPADVRILTGNKSISIRNDSPPRRAYGSSRSP